MAKSKKRSTAARPTRVTHKDTMSPIIQFGVVFFFVAVLVLIFYVAKLY